jgi:hypothetical protein
MTQWNRMMVVVVGCLAVSACGYSEKKFKDDYLASYCAANVACADEGTGVFFTDEAECESFLGAFFGLGTAGCDYDPGAGQACVEALDAAECGDIDSIPDCNTVYSGGACAWGGTTTVTLSE